MAERGSRMLRRRNTRRAFAFVPRSFHSLSHCGMPSSVSDLRVATALFLPLLPVLRLPRLPRLPRLAYPLHIRLPSARARIFQKAAIAAAHPADASAPGPTAALTADACAAAPPPPAPRPHRVAEGPVDGSIGFGRRRGSRAKDAPAPQLQRAGSGGGGVDARRAADAGAAVKADLLDPDFDRRYSKWQAPPPALVPVHGMYPAVGSAAAAAAAAAAATVAAHASLLQQHQHDVAYQSMLRHHAMAQAHAGTDGGGIGGPAAAQAGHVYGGHLQGSHHAQAHSHHMASLFAHQPGAAAAAAAAAAGQPFPFAVQALQGGHGEEQFQHMWLPSHAPHGLYWQGAGAIEPHVARSHGVLRPNAAPEPAKQSTPTQVQYGLNSLADFPSLADVQGTSASHKP
jgi:hypothetical protein